MIDRGENTQDAVAYSEEALKLSIQMARTWSALARMQALELEPYNTTPEQISVLHMITEAGGLSTYKQIARVSIRQYRSMASLINRMVRVGLVKRNQVASKNKYEVSLTEEGATLHKDIPHNAAITFFSCLSPRERQEFSVSLQTLLDYATSVLGLDYVPPYLERGNDANLE